MPLPGPPKSLAPIDGFAPLLLTFANLPQADVGGCAASQWHPVGEIAHQTFAMAKPLI